MLEEEARQARGARGDQDVSSSQREKIDKILEKVSIGDIPLTTRNL